MKRLIVTALAALLCGSLGLTDAFAEEEESIDYARPGRFFTAQGVFAIENIDNADDNTGGFSLGVGYRMGPRAAIELEYEWLDDFGSGGVEVSAWMLGVNGRYYLLQSQVQPFLLLGGGLLVAENDAAGFSDDDEVFAIRLGAGGEIYLTDRLALTTEATYVFPFGELDDFQFGTISAGILYRM